MCKFTISFKTRLADRIICSFACFENSRAACTPLDLSECGAVFFSSMNLYASLLFLGVSATSVHHMSGLLVLRGGEQEFHGLVKKSIDLRLGSHVKRCEIRGSWNDWRPIEMQLVDPNQKIWRKELALPPGEYQVGGGRWLPLVDPSGSSSL